MVIIFITLVISTLTVQSETERFDYVSNTELAIVKQAGIILSEQWPDTRFQIKVRWMHAMLEGKAVRSIQFQSQMPRGLSRATVVTEKGDRYPVQFEVKVSQRVAMLNTVAARNDLITQNQIIYEWADITTYRRLPADTNTQNEWFAARPLQAGSPILQGDLKSPPVIRRGEQAVMTYDGAGVEIDMYCMAQQDGAPGDEITLRCDETGKRYRAQVLNKTTVLWKQTL